MPSFDLRYIQAAKYAESGQAGAKTVTYSNKASMGDAMGVDLQFKFAEGRLYAEGVLAEYIKKATGGTISIAVKYIPAAVQQLLYGAKASTHKQGSASGTQYSGKDIGNYVGVSFYAADKVDGETKYTCVFVSKCLFGPPAMSYKTAGQNINFVTPTTTGEFLPDGSANQYMVDAVTVANEQDAQTWCDAVLTTV